MTSTEEEPGFRVRRARAGDLGAILALWRELDAFQRDWRVFTPRPGVAAEVAEGYRRALTDPTSILLVAVEGDAVVGTAFGHPVTPSSMSAERAIELSGVVVRKDRRGRGIARALAAEVGRFAAAHGFERVSVRTFARNEVGLAFWRGVGFEPRMVQLVIDADRLGEPRSPDRHTPST